MKKIFFGEKDVQVVNFDFIDNQKPIFAKREGKLVGMVVQDNKYDYQWVLRLGGVSGATGHHITLRGCLESCLKYGFEFFVEEE